MLSIGIACETSLMNIIWRECYIFHPGVISSARGTPLSRSYPHCPALQRCETVPSSNSPHPLAKQEPTPAELDTLRSYSGLYEIKYVEKKNRQLCDKLRNGTGAHSDASASSTMQLYTHKGAYVNYRVSGTLPPASQLLPLPFSDVTAATCGGAGPTTQCVIAGSRRRRQESHQAAQGACGSGRPPPPQRRLKWRELSLGTICPMCRTRSSGASPRSRAEMARGARTPNQLYLRKY
jgi:hypothetical protein